MDNDTGILQNADAHTTSMNAPPKGVDSADLFAAVSMMSRFLTRLGNLPQFKQAGIGVAEWSVLSVLSKLEGVSNKELARHLGITGQRVVQIVTGLKTAGHISIVQSPGDTRQNVISLTEIGRQNLTKLNNALKITLVEGLAGRDRVMPSLLRNLRVLMRLVTANKV